jgi:hypothetical protein
MFAQCLKQAFHQDSNMDGKHLLFFFPLFLASALIEIRASNIQIITLNEPPVTGFNQGDADSPGPFIVGIAKSSE